MKTSRRLKRHARRWRLVRYGGSRGRRRHAAIADDGRALRYRAHAPHRALAAVYAQLNRSGLPGFVVNEFRKFHPVLFTHVLPADVPVRQ
jgi:hypothetical protein